jgi:pyruvate dehydrogenase E1 component
VLQSSFVWLTLACITTQQAPDVSTSTQLSGFVNNRGVFGLKESADTAKDLKIMSMNKWNVSHKGQHVELGVCV